MSSSMANSTHTQSEEEKEEESSFMFAFNLCNASNICMAMKAGVELGVFQIMAEAGTDVHLTASEIVAQLPIATTVDAAAAALDRVLMFLVAHSILICSSSAERRYGLTRAGRNLAANNGGPSLVPAFQLSQDPVMLHSWQQLKYSVLEGVTPFNKAHGMSLYDYSGKDPRFNKMFNDAMAAGSTVTLTRILKAYRGFEAVRRLVDIGGGSGESLKLIISKYPHIKGINFDLHHVVSNAPSITGVEHIGGDMFESIPDGGDAIFMKWVLHNWSDDECLKILSNCCKALPNSGKLIAVDQILREAAPENCTAAVTCATQMAYGTDLSMLVFTPGGKERTEKEFELLGKEAGFSGFAVVCPVSNTFVMEFYK